MNPTVDAVLTLLLLGVVLAVALAGYIAAAPFLMRLRALRRRLIEQAGPREFR